MPEESAMKRIFTFVFMIGFATALGAQSLADLAKLEKERREGFKGRHAVVIKNGDLLRVKKRPAVEVAVESEVIPELGEGEILDTESASETGLPAPAASIPPAEEAIPEQIVPPVKAPDVGPALRDELLAAEELADLLGTKIARLRQDYSSQENMVPNYVIEQQLAETRQRLQNAQSEVVRLKREIDRVERERKLAANSIR
jgi:hypothetical protein